MSILLAMLISLGGAVLPRREWARAGQSPRAE
jgi:hypothetical protein